MSVLVSIYAALKSNRRFNNEVQRPGATNRVFEAYSSLAKIDSESPQKKPDPVYHTLEPPTKNQQMPPQEPVYHNPLPLEKKNNSNK